MGHCESRICRRDCAPCDCNCYACDVANGKVAGFQPPPEPAPSREVTEGQAHCRDGVDCKSYYCDCSCLRCLSDGSPARARIAALEQALARAEAEKEEAWSLLDALVTSLPKCDECRAPALRSPGRGRERRCDRHAYISRVPGEAFYCRDEYPRAAPLRAIKEARRKRDEPGTAHARAVAEGRALERADVVAWLDDAPDHATEIISAALKRGEHEGKVGKT